MKPRFGDRSRSPHLEVKPRPFSAKPKPLPHMNFEDFCSSAVFVSKLLDCGDIRTASMYEIHVYLIILVLIEIGYD